MFIEPINTEIVYQVTNQYQIIKEHFNQFFEVFAEAKVIPSSSYECVDGVKRCLSGVPFPIYNAVFGEPLNDEVIFNSLNFFREANVPSGWFIDTDSPNRSRLQEQGYTDTGIYKGVMMNLDSTPYHIQVLPNGFTIDKVKNPMDLDEFCEVILAAFQMPSEIKMPFKKVTDQPRLTNWVVRKDEKIVATLSTIKKDNVISFWNQATSAEFRGLGLSTALCQTAMNEGVFKACDYAVAYLTSEDMSFGIYSKLGFQTQWLFNVYIAP